MAYKDKQTRKNKHFGEALKHAFEGLKVALVEERNLKVHLGLGLLALCLASLLSFSTTEWLILVLTIGLVVTLELLNTLIENLVDLVTEGAYHPLAKKTKDLAAGIVLFASMVAVIIGIILFLPKIIN